MNSFITARKTIIFIGLLIFGMIHISHNLSHAIVPEHSEFITVSTEYENADENTETQPQLPDEEPIFMDDDDKSDASENDPDQDVNDEEEENLDENQD